MFQPVNLFLERFVYLCTTMAMDIGPDRCDTIQVAITISINQIGAFSSLNNDRSFSLPITHLGKGMPDIGLIVFAQGSCIKGFHVMSPERVVQQEAVSPVDLPMFLQ